MWAFISSGFSWLMKWAAPSITTTSSKLGTSFLNPPLCIYSLIPGILYVKSNSPTTNLVGTWILHPLNRAVSSQFLHRNQINLKLKFLFEYVIRFFIIFYSRKHENSTICENYRIHSYTIFNKIIFMIICYYKRSKYQP